MNGLVIRLFEALKNKEISVLKFSRNTGIPHDRIYQWKKDATAPKAADAEKIRRWLNENISEEDTNLQVGEPSGVYEKRSDLSLESLHNLTLSNKILAESNKTLAEANKKLADNTIMLTAAVTASGSSETSLDVLATLEAIREYATELGSELRETSRREEAAELGTKMVQQKKKLERTGSSSAQGK